MTEIILTIEGMSCQHCVMRVRKAIDALPGVASSDVSIGRAVVKYDESKVGKEDIAASVEKAGYKIVS
ncbi:MAG TPA: cation transporter [Dissulfurispiraceae bacterium]|nr:cation transporter [Dissulfurispiraceae bacterium]